MKLAGKVAIVTGGARDIGKATSIKLAQEGAKVVINYLSSEQQAAETVAEIKAKGGEAIAVKGDVSKDADVLNLIQAAQKLLVKTYISS